MGKWARFFISSLGLLSLPRLYLAAADLVPLRVQMDWEHRATFAGFYTAQDQGYYRDQGLDITLIEGGPEIDWLTPLLSGDAGVWGAYLNGLPALMWILGHDVSLIYAEDYGFHGYARVVYASHETLAGH